MNWASDRLRNDQATDPAHHPGGRGFVFPRSHCTETLTSSHSRVTHRGSRSESGSSPRHPPCLEFSFWSSRNCLAIFMIHPAELCPPAIVRPLADAQPSADIGHPHALTEIHVSLPKRARDLLGTASLLHQKTLSNPSRGTRILSQDLAQDLGRGSWGTGADVPLGGLSFPL
jgi:hypothetical protein